MWLDTVVKWQFESAPENCWSYPASKSEDRPHGPPALSRVALTVGAHDMKIRQPDS